MVTKIQKNTYSTDILKNKFEKMVTSFDEDYEGKVISTLIRRKAEKETKKAILYIHGFNDYFFQKEMAFKFNQHSFNFYALDLRKYGRSYLKHQKLNNVRSLTEYYEDISWALQQIKKEGNTKVVLSGHSTGGLIVSVYASEHYNSNLFHALLCNSPFYEFNANIIEKTLGSIFIPILGKYFPNVLHNAGLLEFYGYSLHQEKYGEWDYNLDWKPHYIPKVNLGFIRAIRQFHKKVQKGLKINVPTLILHSNKTIYKKRWNTDFYNGDAVLNVNHIKKYAHKIEGNVTITEIKNGLHDLVLSKKLVREKTYKEIFNWLKNNKKRLPKK